MTHESLGDQVEREALQLSARSGSGSKTHRQQHLLPKSYIAGWETEGKLVAVDLEKPTKRIQTSAHNLGKARDYYRLSESHLPDLYYEVLYSKLETRAKSFIDTVTVSGGMGSLSAQLRSAFAWFLAAQFTRGQAFRADHEAAGIADKNLLIALSGEATRIAQPMIADRHWSVISSPKGGLITTDEPVLPLGGPGTPRSACGLLSDCPVVIFPLSRHCLLVMTAFPMARLSGQQFLLPREVAEVNFELTMNAYRWIFSDRRFDYGHLPGLPPKPSLDATDQGTMRVNRFASLGKQPDWPVQRLWDALAQAVLPNKGASFFRQ